MDERWKLKFACENLHRFIIRLFPTNAHNGLEDVGPPSWSLQVTHEAMLDRFLLSHPHLKRFRADLWAELVRSYGGFSEFWVNATQWHQPTLA
jgi:hypothetical protein